MKRAKTKWLAEKERNPHMLVLGDNIKVIRKLHDNYDNKIDLVYIDPPYNRGDEYTYYTDCFEHDEWIKWITEVISELKPLIAENGSIWISIDDREMAYLKIACDHIFGRDNHICTIVWQKRNTRENRKIFSNNHEYILVYAINPQKFKEKRNFLPATEEMISRYKNPDNDPRGPWQSVSLNVQDGHAAKSQFYTIVSPTGVEHVPPQGRCWVYNEQRMVEEINNNNIWFGQDGTSTPRLKKFMKDSVVGIIPETLWTADFAGTNKAAKNELLLLKIFEKNVFDTPKPEKLIARILQIATNKDDIVLDCFLGSGTTAAVAHKMGRNYIGVDNNPEIFKYERARMDKVIKGEQGGISVELNWQGGGDYSWCKW